ncbi:hypothetical protein CcI49_23755 [Frankia sp. CcI49]|uniref:DUF4287 domain-containing protein n=1 Tax=Parafrankia irregularis TaxID=795642 RepID=A0A0S4QW97_9ACTN|nr:MULTISPECIES: DUF4287 domain-containing protein [Frankiaceae]KPM57486.1 hypothetical protein ACG83_07335 [Frankia sp. R43]MBE3205066.1 DUF4287 domain-containing protein [Parafrankia sp. CH37]ONH57955.1 hypothetical protein CcI49_23755 [Frankia sp. CcI49]CUU58710.1 protein of unknown function (DUF4287) [Parafrankia irregularis]
MSLYRSPLYRSPQTHRGLIDRMPKATGHDLRHWLACLNEGPGLLRFSERVGWLRDIHGVPHRYAAAVVHEADLRRHAIQV